MRTPKPLSDEDADKLIALLDAMITARDESALRRVSNATLAADCLCALKVMTLDRQVDELLAVMSEAARDGGDVGAIAQTHLDLVRERNYWQSELGRREMGIDILRDLFKKELDAGKS